MKTPLRIIRIAAAAVAAIVATHLAGAATITWSATNNVSVNTNWSRPGNWSGGVAPGSADFVKFNDNGAATVPGTVNNVVDAAFGGTIGAVQYGSVTNAFTTLISSGVTLTVLGGVTAGTETDKTGAQQETNTIIGAGATLALNNTSSNLIVRQCTAGANGSLRSTFDLSGLDTFSASISNVLVGQQISTTLFRATGTLLLARTNLLTLSGSFLVADTGNNAGGQNYLYLGQTNAVFADAVSVALSKALGQVYFNSTFANPVLYLRGKTATRVGNFRIADNSAVSGVTGASTGIMDLSAGTVDAQVGNLSIAKGQNGAGTGASTGTLTLGAGTFDADVAEVGYEQNTGNASVSTGTINVNGTATYVVNTSLRLARYLGTGTAPVGNLNVNGGTVLVKGTIIAGGGTSTISVNGGTVITTNSSATIGASAALISTLNLSNAVLNLTPSTGAPALNVAALNSMGSTNTINIYSLPNIPSYPTTIHLVSYANPTGNNALIGLGSLPAASPAYQGSVVDNGGVLDLVLTDGPKNGPPSPPTGLGGVAIADGQIALSWNPSLGATSYNVWRSLTSGSGYSLLAANVPGASYTDATAVDGVKRYYYEVTASNSNGTSVASAEVGVLAALQLEFSFEDSGTTTTDAISGVTLTLVNGADAPTDLHGAPGSGAEGLGKALDFSSNLYNSPPTGPLASVVNSSALGFGTVSNFTVTFWVEPDSDFVSVASANTNNPRLFTLAPGPAADYGANPGISLSVNNWNGSAPQTNGIKMNLNGTETSFINFHTLPHYWTFVALTYDGSVLRLYSGSTLTGVKYLGSQANAGQALNFGAAGTLLLGNRTSLSKGVDAWMDDFRFYTMAASTNFLESIRQSSAIIGLSSLYPSDSLLLEGTNTLAFTATSPNGIAAGGFQVVLNGADVSSQLVVGGTTASRTVAYSGLESNQLYSAAIKVTDAAGAVAAMQYSFDTFSANTFTWEAEDFDYYSGQFIDNPQIDGYLNLAGSLGIDENVPSQPTGAQHNYRTGNDVGTDISPDVSREQYLTPQPTNDYYVGWWANGGWLNYTRTYPTGTFNIYARLSGNIGPSTVTLSQVLTGQGTSSQTTSNLGTFSFYGGDVNTYQYVPLRDGFGNLVALALGGVETLRLTTDGGANANFLMLVPAQLTLPVIANVYPDGLKLMEPASSFSFTASSANTTINNSGISLVLNGTNVSAQLQITGSSTSKNVTCPGLASNMAYTAVITVKDANGTTATSTINFDTFSPTVLWEAEDYDFNGGQFIDNPTPTSTAQAGSYFGQFGDPTVDYYDVTTGTTPHLYRSVDAVSTDFAGDTPRQKFLDAQVSDPNVKDYEVGYFTSGEWLNFTRTFPAGTYNLYARLAENANVTGTASLSLVTSGWGTTTQTTNLLGTFSFTGVGWQTYKYVPLYDPFGNLARVTLSGTNTLRLTSATSGGVNANFLMAVPARTDLPIITGLYPDGTGFFQDTNKLTFTVSSPSGINTANIHLTLNGVDVSAGLVFTGSPTAWTVTYSLLPNMTYTASISATDNSGNVVRGGSTFDTFSSANFTWEAEDFDFNGGQFIDNPVVSTSPEAGSYFQYPNGDAANVAQVGVDLTTPQNSAGEQLLYRPDESCGTAVAQDFSRAQFTAAGASDYYVGWWPAGAWINYTRTFPTNTYHLYARLAYNAAYSVTASLVSGGWGTPDQSTVTLGTFSATGTGFQAWQWVQLLDGNSQPVAVALGGISTLKMTAGTGVNANFYMLVPATTPPANVMIEASLSGTNVVISFPTAVGFTYTVLTKNNLADPTWTPLISVPGDGSMKSVTDPATAAKRYYRLSIQ